MKLFLNELIMFIILIEKKKLQSLINIYKFIALFFNGIVSHTLIYIYLSCTARCELILIAFYTPVCLYIRYKTK